MATVEERMREYEDAYGRYQEYAGQEGKFKEGLEDKLRERLGFNKDLIEQQGSLQTQRATLPSQLRQEYGGSAITNPLAQEALISGRRATLGEQLGNVQNLLGERGQYVSDILGRGTTQFQSELAGRNTMLDRAREMLAMAREDEARRRAAAAAAANAQAIRDAMLAGQDDGMGELSAAEEEAIERATYADRVGVPVEQVYDLPGGGYSTFDPAVLNKQDLSSALTNREGKLSLKSFGSNFLSGAKDIFNLPGNIGRKWWQSR